MTDLSHVLVFIFQFRGRIMSTRHGVAKLFAFVLVSFPALLLSAQGSDPLTLQRRAIERIDAVIDAARKTGNLRLADLAPADADLTASNRALSSRGDWSALALGLTKQGSIYRMQGRWDNAITLYTQAEEAAKRGRDVALQSDALAWRALAESSKGVRGAALTDATEAVRLASGITDRDILARALDVLGSVQIAQGNLSGAAATIDREIEVAQRANDPMARYYAFLNRSEIFLKIAEQCDYKRDFKPCYQALDDSRDDLQRAVGVVRPLGYTALSQQVADGQMADVEDRRKLIRSIESQTQTVQSLDVFHPVKPSDVLVTERFVPEPGPIPPALSAIYEAGKRMQQQAGGFADTSQAQNYYVDGLMNEMGGNNNAALASYLKALETLEKDRRALHDERSRGTFLENRITIYYAAVLQLLERRQYDQAFQILERSRSRALADVLATRSASLGRPEEQQLYGEWTSMRANIADAQGQLSELLVVGDAAGNRTRITGLQSRIQTLEAQEQTLVSRMSREAPRLLNLVSREPESLTALQLAMRRDGFEMLQYTVLETGVLLWHITPDSVTVRNVFLPRTEIMKKVASLKDSIARPEKKFDERTAKELFLFLVQPVLSRIRSPRLVIVPHEDLQYIPFQVLQDPADGRFMGERFQITYVPSASIFLSLPQRSGIRSGRLLAVADPGIPDSVKEVTAIAGLFPNRNKVLSEILPTEDEVKLAMRDFDVIHLSVHGTFDSVEPMLSFLTLGRGRTGDGKLTAAEMFGLPLDQSKLVVLSGCETGRASATHGDEILGMTRALLFAGASTLVVSNWKVDAAATAEWMQTFYEELLNKPAPEAARAALVRVKSRPGYSHPFYWAAFTMVGRPL